MRKPRFYFSFHSPFSWMASHLVEWQVPDAHERVEYIPYFEPDEQTWTSLNERGVEMHAASAEERRYLAQVDGRVVGDPRVDRLAHVRA